MTKRIEDDRQRLTGDSRVILIVEDDEKFSRILYDPAHDLKFQWSDCDYGRRRFSRGGSVSSECCDLGRGAS